MQNFEGQSFPILTNGSRVWLINHLYLHVIFTDCERQDKIFVIAGLVIAGLVIAGFVSIYFTVILPGFQML